jgi:hypothetical protein
LKNEKDDVKNKSSEFNNKNKYDINVQIKKQAPIRNNSNLNTEGNVNNYSNNISNTIGIKRNPIPITNKVINKKVVSNKK